MGAFAKKFVERTGVPLTSMSLGRVSPISDTGNPRTSQKDSESDKVGDSRGRHFPAVRIANACVTSLEE